MFFRSLLLSAFLSVGCHRLYPSKSIAEVQYPAEPRTLDWIHAEDSSSQKILEHTQRGLTCLDEKGKLHPALADSWTVSPDEKHFVFQLGDGKWSDGVPVKAEDFVFAWKRHLSGNSATLAPLLQIAEAKHFHQSGKDFAGVGLKAVSAKTLEIELSVEDENFARKLADPRLGPQREDVWRSFPEEFASPLQLRATGPYQVLEWKKGESLLLVANSYYYGGKPTPEKIQIRFGAD